MADGGIDFSKPIGPLPTGAWIAIVAAGVGLVFYSRTHATSASSTTTPTTIDPNSANAIGTGPGWVAVTPPTTSPTNIAQTATNDTWAITSITWLIAQGVQPSLADAAIRAYINGQDYSNAQYQSIVDMALKQFGPPPETLTPFQNAPGGTVTPPVHTPPPVTTPPPTYTPPPAPKPVPTPGTTQRRFTVGRWPSLAGSLSGIAILMYGNASRWPDIYNANRALIGPNPNMIQPGQVLVIP